MAKWWNRCSKFCFAQLKMIWDSRKRLESFCSSLPDGSQQKPQKTKNHTISQNFIAFLWFFKGVDSSMEFFFVPGPPGCHGMRPRHMRKHCNKTWPNTKMACIDMISFFVVYVVYCSMISYITITIIMILNHPLICRCFYHSAWIFLEHHASLTLGYSQGFIAQHTFPNCICRACLNANRRRTVWRRRPSSL